LVSRRRDFEEGIYLDDFPIPPIPSRNKRDIIRTFIVVIPVFFFSRL
jgi:hypothetical protein